ncbi:MAG: hypothetical protein ABFC89_02685 [Methanospirillum sp.]
MDAARVAPVVAIVAGAAAVWLVPGLDPLLGGLVAVLGAVVAVSFLTDRGGLYVVLCMGEAFAVGLAVAAPVLGVLAQPLVAALVVGTDDRQGFLLAAGAATVAAGAVLLVRHTLAPLLVVAVAAAVVVLALLGLEAWLKRRFAGGQG